mgnify:CR=1 FL=1
MDVSAVIDAVKNNDAGWRDTVNAAWGCLSVVDKQLIALLASSNSSGGGITLVDNGGTGTLTVGSTTLDFATVTSA